MSEWKLSRRAFLAGTAAALSGCGSTGMQGSSSLQEDSDSLARHWTNWSGSVTCTPRTLSAPRRGERLIEAVRQAVANGEKVRVAASGHSFVPLCASDGTLISLDGLVGIDSLDREALTANVLAGTKIHQLGEPLRAAGMAMRNMGDIDRQGIAGAISTGTHGTGQGIGSISTQVIGLRLVTATGDTVECSADDQPELLNAARVSLGALGIITHVHLQLVPAFRLHEKVWEVPFEECVEKLDRLIAANRHFEFFWWPRRDTCSMKTLNPSTSAPDDLPEREGERIGHSNQIFPSVRNNKFNEIEFAVPEQNGLDCFREIRRLLLEKHTDIEWPIEYRTLGQDDIYLSPAHGRDTITISAHQANTLPYQAFFADVEAIFRSHDGRPHWGKIHTHTAAELAELYPRWDDFHKVRRELDPSGVFMNEHLQRIFV